MKEDKLRIGVSSCLMGEEVRYDGGHKWSSAVVNVIGIQATLVPVCPEIEIGLGVPRSPLNLVDVSEGPRLVVQDTGADLTRPMMVFSAKKIQELQKEGLDGFILKKSSPSCGIGNVKVYRNSSLQKWTASGQGIFARCLKMVLPTLPVVEEDALSEQEGISRFLEDARRYRILKNRR